MYALEREPPVFHSFEIPGGENGGKKNARRRAQQLTHTLAQSPAHVALMLVHCKRGSSKPLLSARGAAKTEAGRCVCVCVTDALLSLFFFFFFFFKFRAGTSCANGEKKKEEFIRKSEKKNCTVMQNKFK